MQQTQNNYDQSSLLNNSAFQQQDDGSACWWLKVIARSNVVVWELESYIVGRKIGNHLLLQTMWDDIPSRQGNGVAPPKDPEKVVRESKPPSQHWYEQLLCCRDGTCYFQVLPGTCYFQISLYQQMITSVQSEHWWGIVNAANTK